MTSKDEAHLFTEIPEDTPKFLTPSYLRQAVFKAYHSRDTESILKIKELLNNNLHCMSHEALDEAKSIGKGVSACYPRSISDSGIQRLNFLYSILIAQAINASALEGLLLLNRKIEGFLPLNSDNPEKVFDMYIRHFSFKGLKEEVDLVRRNKTEYLRGMSFIGMSYPYVINDVPNKLSSLFVYLAKENIERTILMGKGINLTSEHIATWAEEYELEYK